jgi:hypothetical protein
VTTSNSTADLAVAARELRAARAIVLDPTCDDQLAAGHLATAWEALARASVPGGPDPKAAPSAQTWLSPGDRAAMPPRAAVEVAEVLPAVLAQRGRPPHEPGAWTVPHAVLERHVDGLAQLLAQRHREPRRFSPRARRLLLAVAGLGAVAVLVVRPWQSESFGPWAGTYYNRPDFTGASVQRRDLDINFEWKEKPPMDKIPADRYSVRWDTCLTIDREKEVAFQLVSDDGSRLYVDGKQIIDNWGKHAVRARGKTITLTPGVHHLRVEYFEERNEATIALVASLDGETPGPIPRRLLSAPETADDDDDDAAGPCGS